MQHQDHDLSLIAGLAADDVTTAERTRAQLLLASCPECTALHDDLLAIARATRTLPAPSAPRDFRITADQAARLRRTSWVAKLLRPFAGPASIARPLAATFSTLGLVGVFVASAVPGMLGGAASMAAPESAGGNGVTGPVAASGAPGLQFGPAATAGSGDGGYGAKDNVEASAAPLVGQGAGSGSTGGTAGNDGDGTTRDLATYGADLGSTPTATPTSQPSPPNLLLLGSLAFLAVGLALFGLRFAGRRLR
jgi:hypothetical protein